MQKNQKITTLKIKLVVENPEEIKDFAKIVESTHGATLMLRDKLDLRLTPKQLKDSINDKEHKLRSVWIHLQEDGVSVVVDMP